MKHEEETKKIGKFIPAIPPGITRLKTRILQKLIFNNPNTNLSLPQQLWSDAWCLFLHNSIIAKMKRGAAHCGG